MKQNLQQQLNTLKRLYKESDDLYRGIASKFGITDTAFWILYAISHTEGDCTQNDLCNNWFYPVQTINSSVSKLQKEGLVRLETIPGTRNRKRILLTEAGEQFTERIISKIDDLEEEAFLMFTDEERETYISLYQRYNENIRHERDRVLGTLTEL
ncbi:MarR family transcriptional regulator [Lacrimispora sp.]|uniref:MarR family winged helix-turn-helix transcriptional regulator n=1 Tax=Lacrimispora sp. TaxID=2719234 RepID=UPI0032E374EB